MDHKAQRLLHSFTVKFFHLFKQFPVIFFIIGFALTLLLCASSTHAVEIEIDKIMDEINSSIKNALVSGNNTQQAIENIINEGLKKHYIKYDEIRVKNLLIDILPRFIEEYKKTDGKGKENALSNIATAVRTTVAMILKENSDFDKKLENMNERIEKLEAAKQPKMLSPYKDVDFLFEVVVGDIYDALMMDSKMINIDNNKIQKIEIVRNWVYKDIVILTFEQQKQPIQYEDLAQLTIEAKMQAVEKTIGITRKPDADLMKRIDLVYQKINNRDWQNDDLRFGILTSYISETNVNVISIALHGYFAYRRFTPGKWDWNNIGRRLSGFFAVGAGGTADKSAEVKNPVLSVGIGFDIVKGFAVSAGGSVFSYRASVNQDFQSKGAWTFGVTLNSDLWRALFNK